MKFLSCLVLSTGFYLPCWSQGTTITAGNTNNNTLIVPPPVEQKFVIEHPQAKARWKKDGVYYKALFVNPVNTLGQIIVYDSTGSVIRRERELEQQEFPPAIIEHQEKKYPGEGVAVWVSVDSTGNNLFYTQKNNVTYWFDRNGRPISGEKRFSRTDSISGPGR